LTFEIDTDKSPSTTGGSSLNGCPDVARSTRDFPETTEKDGGAGESPVGFRRENRPMPRDNPMKPDLYYEVHGEGDTLLLLHHGFGCSKIWGEIYPTLVKAGYRVVFYDRRGYGRSERFEDFPASYVSDRFRSQSVEDLAALVEHLDLHSFHIVGQCEGGVVALDYTAAFPDRVKTITVSSTQCYSRVPMEELNREKFPTPFKDLPEGLRKKLIDWHGEEYAEPFFNQFRLYGGAYGRGIFDLRPLLPDITCPVLVLYPDRSSIFDVDQGLAFYHRLPNAELSVLPRCGHNTYEHYPEEYTRQIIQFLKRNGF